VRILGIFLQSLGGLLILIQIYIYFSPINKILLNLSSSPSHGKNLGYLIFYNLLLTMGVFLFIIANRLQKKQIEKTVREKLNNL
jgi:hypothetical protein